MADEDASEDVPVGGAKDPVAWLRAWLTKPLDPSHYAGIKGFPDLNKLCIPVNKAKDGTKSLGWVGCRLSRDDAGMKKRNAWCLW